MGVGNVIQRFSPNVNVKGYNILFFSKLWLVTVCMVLFGTGFGGTRVIAYVDCLNEAV